jgi:hypothetical protein
MQAGRQGRAYRQAGNIRQADIAEQAVQCRQGGAGSQVSWAEQVVMQICRQVRAGRQESTNEGMAAQAERAEQEGRQVRARMQVGRAEQAGR